MSTPDLQCVGTTGHFYHRPLPGAEVRFSQQPVGVNKLATLNKSMCTKAGLQGNISNHSGKRTCATSLFHEGFDEQMVSSRTGHRSTAIRDYKVPSDEQQFALWKILDPPTANMVSTVTLHDTDGDSDERRAKIPCTHGPAANVSTNLISRETSVECPVSLPLSGTFQNCTFNFSFFFLVKSETI